MFSFSLQFYEIHLNDNFTDDQLKFTRNEGVKKMVSIYDLNKELNQISFSPVEM